MTELGNGIGESAAPRGLRRLGFDRRSPGVWVSAVAHGAILVAGLAAFTSDTLPESQEGIPVEIVMDNPTGEIPKGENAPEVTTRQERADRQAEQRVANLPGQAEKDIPTPPTRAAETKVDDEEAVPPPMPPTRPDTTKADAEAKAAAAAAAKADADAKAAARAEAAARADAAAKAAAKVAAAKAADAAKAEAAKVAEAKAEAAREAQEEAEEKAEAERTAAAKAKAQADAKAKADKARAEAKAAEAKAEAAAKAALEKKLAEAEAEAAEAKRKTAEAKAAADAKAKADAKAQAQAKAQAEARAKADADAKARRQAALADRFNPGDISRLVGTEAPQGSGASARQVQRTASLGAASGQSAKLSPSERDQIVGIINEQLHRCWQVPMGADGADKPPNPVINVRIAPDGSLAGDPTVQNGSAHPLFRMVADAAVRATKRCTPLRIPAKFAAAYDVWKSLAVSYNVRD
jgi:colicin import membrane protein